MGTGSGVSLRTWKRTALYRLYDAKDALSRMIHGKA